MLPTGDAMLWLGIGIHAHIFFLGPGSGSRIGIETGENLWKESYHKESEPDIATPLARHPS